MKDAKDKNPEPNFPPSVDHMAFGVEDVDKGSEELRSQGIIAEVVPRDPAGRLVELHKVLKTTMGRGPAS